MEELPVEIATSAGVAGIGGEIPRVIDPRRHFDERRTIVKRKEMAPPAKI